MKIYFKDLPCAKNIKAGSKRYSPNQAFDLSRYPQGPLRYDFAALIFDRAEHLSASSLRSEQTSFHGLGDFLSKEYPQITHLTDVPLPELERSLKVYLVINSVSLTSKRNRKEFNRTYYVNNPLLNYLRMAYEYFTPKEAAFSKDNDVWSLSSLPFPVNKGTLSTDKTISFENINQPGIKKEVKEATYYNLRRLSVIYTKQQILSASNLSEFLYKNHPEVSSLKSMTRDLLEEYLTYLYLEQNKKTNVRSELVPLKSIFNVIGKLLEYDNLRGIFLRSDFPGTKKTIYKSYSDAELERLHTAYAHLDKQTARLLLIHEMLGLRISETLTLKTDDIDFKEMTVKVYQEKTNKSYTKKLDDRLLSLLKACIDDTTSKYGDCVYIFVSNKDPSKPLSYSALTYRLRSLIISLDLRDDNGNLFSPKTHLFRHTYGKKLCDMFNDDATISALLGHSSLSSVSFYRQMSPKALLDSVKPVLDKRNEKIKQFKKGWMA